ncbi:MAG TPA: hypothetical protein VNG71_17135 [Pyrinomonadaceae bacterium]|nr:hypothetical protein [Pyrinomonadaceae bacterium]
MENVEITHRTTVAEIGFMRISLVYAALFLATLSFTYLNGFSYRLLSLSSLVLTWSCLWLAGIALVYFSRLPILPSAFLSLMPALFEFARGISRVYGYRLEPGSGFELVNALFNTAEIFLVMFTVTLFRSHGRPNSARPQVITPVGTPPAVAKKTLEPDFPLGLLGRGQSQLDAVIRSVVERSTKSDRHANFSLAVMLVLVMIGGMASFGLWAFTHADRISTLEAEKNKLTGLQEGFRGAASKLVSNDPTAKDSVDRISKFIQDNYPNSETYRDTLNRLSQQSQTNYADIAIRVTIAVLTIFLVQVFFAVYKYNRHLAIILAAKAEALELAGSDEDSRKELSREAVSIVKEGVPGFSAHPRTPIEEIIQAAERLKR